MGRGSGLEEFGGATGCRGCRGRQVKGGRLGFTVSGLSRLNSDIFRRDRPMLVKAMSWDRAVQP